MSNKRNDSQVPESSSYYENIIDCMPDLVYVLNKDCELQECNNNMLRFLGVESKHQIESSIYKQLQTEAKWSEERAQLLKKMDIAALLSEELTTSQDEPPVIDKNNEIIYFRGTRTPLFNKDKTINGLLVILRDITHEKRLEEQFEKVQVELEKNSHRQRVSTNAFNMANIPRILLIEDNSIAQKAGQALLMQLDCRVEVAASEKAVEELFEPGKFNVVLMDIGLEDTSGYVLSKRIRQMEKDTNFHVPIIALTGYEADVVKYDCNDYNMEGAITKPLTSEQAQQIIQHYVYHIDIPVNGLKSIKSH